MYVQVWKITNNLVTQLRDLAKKVTLLEEEKEKNTKSIEKLLKALKEKTTALEEKEKEWAERGKEVRKLETDITLLRSREINQEAFTKLVMEKVLRTVDFGELAVKMSAAATDI